MTISISNTEDWSGDGERLALGNAAYAWLSSYFKEVEKQTGKLIHPYENVSLKEEELDKLKAELDRAMSDVKSGPLSFSVVYLQRTLANGKNEDISHTFEKSQAEEFLKTFIRMAGEARALNQFLFFKGL